MYCSENDDEWDEGIPFVLFALRNAVQESLGFSPFELIFGHSVRGPVRMLKEKWVQDENETNVPCYVSKFQNRLVKAWKIASKNLGKAHLKMKDWYKKIERKLILPRG